MDQNFRCLVKSEISRVLGNILEPSISVGGTQRHFFMCAWHRGGPPCPGPAGTLTALRDTSGASPGTMHLVPHLDTYDSSRLWDYLAGRPGVGREGVERVWSNIQDIVIRTLVCADERLRNKISKRKSMYNCYNLTGRAGFWH